MSADSPRRPARAAALAELDQATARLVTTVGRLDDPALAAPSALPGWTRGHVVAHLSRNADGLGNLARWADTGVETPMYVSRDARATAIEADAYRPADVQLADLVGSAEVLAARLATMGPHADDTGLRLVSGAEVEGWELPLLRLREVEIHHVDLAAGYTVADWPEPFCLRTLEQVAPGFAARDQMPFGRLSDGTGRSWTVGVSSATVTGPVRSLLGWLLGRADGSDLLPTGRDDVPPAPAWS